MKILIAEDDPISGRLIQANLNRWGFETEIAIDGEAAVETFDSDEQLQLAILDWMMPKLDGLQVCRYIKGIVNRPFTYVIVLTARSTLEDIEKAFQAGADDFIVKPVSAVELKSRVNAGKKIIDLESSLRLKIDELKKALTEVKVLQGIIPICSWCKKIRDDKDYWTSVEEYIHRYSSAEFSHSICPECRDELFKDMKIKKTH